MLSAELPGSPMTSRLSRPEPGCCSVRLERSEPERGFGVLPKHRLGREGTAGAAAPLVLATEAGCTPQEAME